jgi:hypothetical protein
MANKPGKSMSHTSQERSLFQAKATKVTIPAMTPKVIVRKPEKWSKSFVTETNNVTNRIVNPTDHHPNLL